MFKYRVGLIDSYFFTSTLQQFRPTLSWLATLTTRPKAVLPWPAPAREKKCQQQQKNAHAQLLEYYNFPYFFNK